jgi:hypothetical protein
LWLSPWFARCGRVHGAPMCPAHPQTATPIHYRLAPGGSPPVRMSVTPVQRPPSTLETDPAGVELGWLRAHLRPLRAPMRRASIGSAPAWRGASHTVMFHVPKTGREGSTCGPAGRPSFEPEQVTTPVSRTGLTSSSSAPTSRANPFHVEHPGTPCPCPSQLDQCSPCSSSWCSTPGHGPDTAGLETTESPPTDRGVRAAAEPQSARRRARWRRRPGRRSPSK